jgi:hypothetical protein
MIDPTPVTPQGFRAEIPPFRTRADGPSPWEVTGWSILVDRGSDGVAVRLIERQWRRQPDHLIASAGGMYRFTHGDLDRAERVLGGLQIVRQPCGHQICELTVACIALCQAVVAYDECLDGMTLDSDSVDIGDRADYVVDMDPLF